MSGITRREAKQCVGRGWERLIDKVYDAKPRSTHIIQVKEKFGGLRVYCGGSIPEFFAIIDQAEKESYEICEECGDPGKLREDLGWILTLCDKHYQKRITRLGRIADNVEKLVDGGEK